MERTPGGDADMLRAEALGEPGRRRFRIVAVIDGETYIMWMEKQQVQALGLAIAQLIDTLPDLPGYEPGANAPAIVDEDTRHQFRVGRIEIAFDASAARIVIAAYDIEDDDSESHASLAMRITRQQGLDLSAEAEDLVARGRPMCPMCGSPMDSSGHVCPQQNGHLPLRLGDEFA
jgi:uncharacterized repeat protein (TIGR03847 family)